MKEELRLIERINCINQSLSNLTERNDLPEPSVASLLMDTHSNSNDNGSKTTSDDCDINNQTSTTTTTDITSSSSFSQQQQQQQQQQQNMNDRTKRYAPITLEKQFQDLYRLLRPALILSSPNGTSTSSNTNTTTTSNSNTNASAFIQGSRGSGKSLLVRQVLQAIIDEIHQTKHILQQKHQQQQLPQQFRYVYINGNTWTFGT
jgi:predicted AAA+ superfamily ATPase